MHTRTHIHLSKIVTAMSRFTASGLDKKEQYSYSKANPKVWLYLYSNHVGGGWVVRWSWINFQVRGVLLVWKRVGQGPTALAVGAGGGCLDIFTLIYPFSFLSPSLWETTRYRLKYYLKGSLSPKTTNQINSCCWL